MGQWKQLGLALGRLPVKEPPPKAKPKPKRVSKSKPVPKSSKPVRRSQSKMAFLRDGELDDPLDDLFR